MTEVATSSPPRRIVALAGNPRPGSRTLRVARAVAGQIATGLGVTEPVVVVDLAEIADQLFAAESAERDRLLRTVAEASIVVVATPVYKASYTGLLKAFVDRYPAGALGSVVAVPVVVSASPTHSFVAEQLLRPLLLELGATAPTRALAVLESQLDDLDAVVATWGDTALPVLTGVLSTGD